MTRTEEMHRCIGWLYGFTPCVWLLAGLKGIDGAALVSDEACAEYEHVVRRLRDLLEDE